MRGNYANNVVARHPGALQRPFAGIPLYRDPTNILGWTDRQKADWTLANARTAVPSLERRLASVCAALDQANKVRGIMRRRWQADVFRKINAACRQLRAARLELAAAEAAAAPFALISPPAGRPAA